MCPIWQRGPALISHPMVLSAIGSSRRYEPALMTACRHLSTIFRHRPPLFRRYGEMKACKPSARHALMPAYRRVTDLCAATACALLLWVRKALIRSR
jgi:hypothetical protein